MAGKKHPFTGYPAVKHPKIYSELILVSIMSTLQQQTMIYHWPVQLKNCTTSCNIVEVLY